MEFVKVQAILLTAAVAAASRVIVPAASTVVAVPEPMPVQVAAIRTYPAGMVSVIVVTVEAAASILVAPATPVPGVTVVMTWAPPKPLSPLNVKGPIPPSLILVIVILGSLVFVKVHATALPGAVAAALSVSTLPASVAVPAPMPEQVAEARL